MVKPIILQILLFLILFFLFPLSASSAQLRALEIDISFTPPDDPNRIHTGYRLYQEGRQVCETNDPAATVITCEFVSENGTFDFTLSALYSDDSESPQSPAVAFTFGETTPPDVTKPPASGNKTISYSWEAPVDILNIAGYRMYMNNTMLCETAEPTTSTLICPADLINEPMTFAITSYDGNNLESAKSNFLLLDPSDFPELFRAKNITFAWEYTDDSSNAGGFEVYHNDTPLCKTTDSTARTLACELRELNLQNEFKIAALDAANTATLFSNLIIYTQTDSGPVEPPVQEELKASFTATPTAGEAPLSVSFNATASTGDIAAYNWNFGDGFTGTGSTVNHSFPTAGTLSTTLTVVDSVTRSDLATTTITVQEPPPLLAQDPPTAVISSSTALGKAPLDVTFDGSGSTTANPPLTSYMWNYGDGSKGSGDVATHVYNVAGSFSSELEVTDSKGMTGSAATPVIVTESTKPNAPPTASFTAIPAEGETPLTVSFNGSASSDADGTVNSYQWNFGDGSTGSGSTAQHTYGTAAVFSATLQVRDDQGELSQIVSKNITVKEGQLNTEFLYEAGEIALTHEWVQVMLSAPFTNPIVLISPPTSSDAEPVFTRVRNLSRNGFEVRLQEWDYQDGTHQQETVGYLVVEQGVIILEDGTLLEAGTFSGSTAAKTISFQQNFTNQPVVVTTILTTNDPSGVTGRITSTSDQEFSYKMQEEEAADQQHSNETIAYLAWEPGRGTSSGLDYEVSFLYDVGHFWTTARFITPFQTLPFLFADMQTTKGPETASIRINNHSKTAVDLKIAEEQSNDREMRHRKETLGYIALSPTTPELPPTEPVDSGSKMFTFNWEFTGDENAIAGFRFYMNNTLICGTANPADRSITCYTSPVNEVMEFTMKHVFHDGSESERKTTFILNPYYYPDIFDQR